MISELHEENQDKKDEPNFNESVANEHTTTEMNLIPDNNNSEPNIIGSLVESLDKKDDSDNDKNSNENKETSENDTNNNTNIEKKEDKKETVTLKVNNNSIKQSSKKSLETSKKSSAKLSYEYTLNEKVFVSFYRDLKLIFHKIMLAINPFIDSKKFINEITDWELYGPLIFLIFLSSSLTISSKSNQFVLIFFIFFIGALIIYLNGIMLSNKSSYFSYCSLLGYCITPFCLMSIFTLFFRNLIVKISISSFALIWSSIGIFRFVNLKTKKNKVILMAYPMELFLGFFWYMLIVC